jgi:ABC-type uncharacterized transport system involved in gliding motility auxiliary subunit
MRGPVSIAVASQWASDPVQRSAPPEGPEIRTEEAHPVDGPAETRGGEADPIDGESAPAAVDPEEDATTDSSMSPRPVDTQGFETRSDLGRLVVIGDADFASDLLLTNYVGNEQLLLNMVSWLCAADELISLPAKDKVGHHVTLTRERSYLLVMLTLFIIPGSVSVAGLRNWWRRRRL